MASRPGYSSVIYCYGIIDYTPQTGTAKLLIKHFGSLSRGTFIYEIQIINFKNLYNMKKLAIILGLVLFSLGINAQIITPKPKAPIGEQPEGKFPVIKFETPKHDFGTLHEGDVVKYVYKFQNVGDAPLLISRIKASCGCTIPSNWKKEPIMPGEKSEFTVQFNTRNKIHQQHKTVTVYCNTKNKTERVYFTANVIPDPKMEKQREERRKRWAEQRKRNQQKRNRLQKNKKTVKLDFAAKDKIATNEINIKKLEVKLLKLQQKLDRKMHAGKISKDKIKKYKDKITALKKEIDRYEVANKKIRSGK